MASTSSTEQVTVKDPVRVMERLRGASMGALVMLILEFALGIGVNLYITPAKGGIGKAFTNGPLLALHAVLGLLLILAAIGLLVQAIQARHRAVIAVSALGLIAVLAAAFNGTAFLSNQDKGTSMGMAMATAVAMFCYAVCLRIIPPPGRWKT
jgi:hypothetical protein